MSYTVRQLDSAVANPSWWPGTGEEFEDEDSGGDGEQEGWGALYSLMDWGYYSNGEWKKYPVVKLPGIGSVEKIDNFGGEGQGDDYWVVVKITGEDGSERIFRRNGWYASYDGGYYDGPTEEVKSVEKVITVWEKISEGSE